MFQLPSTRRLLSAVVIGLSLLFFFGFVHLTALQAAPRLQEEGTPADSGLYVVQPGDTVVIIADQFGITVEELRTLNDIPETNVIYVGQTLNVGNGQAATEAITATAVVSGTSAVTAPAEVSTPDVATATVTTGEVSETAVTTETEEMTATAEVSGTSAVTAPTEVSAPDVATATVATGEVSETAVTTGTEEMTATAEVSGTSAVTAPAEVSAPDVATATVATGEVSETAVTTGTEEMTATAAVTGAAAITATTVVTTTDAEAEAAGDPARFAAPQAGNSYHSPLAVNGVEIEAGQEVQVRLTDDRGATIAERTLTPGEEGLNTYLRFTIRNATSATFEITGTADGQVIRRESVRLLPGQVFLDLEAPVGGDKICGRALLLGYSSSSGGNVSGAAYAADGALLAEGSGSGGAQGEYRAFFIGLNPNVAEETEGYVTAFTRSATDDSLVDEIVVPVTFYPADSDACQ
ncbi:MAG: LysM peptidoglycan-binding domain-containing protein [Caldilineaceae bacterium]|nr:LysM peptidoglycan-binding domain-containing protein [Caldilineaceae bacterium]